MAEYQENSSKSQSVSSSETRDSLFSDAEAFEGDEEFYEEIEAPNFVDFTVPDHFCPDDRYWFCHRVGCDQKHEEEMDSEAIYKKFVLRVMAARSPNVRLRKVLDRNASKNVHFQLLQSPQSQGYQKWLLSPRFLRKVLAMNDQSGQVRKKVIQAHDRNLKEGLISCSSTVVKLKKPKATNPKPFRLRTDERGIRKETKLERRTNYESPQTESAALSTLSGKLQMNKQGNDNNTRVLKIPIGPVIRENLAAYTSKRHQGSSISPPQKRIRGSIVGRASFTESSLEESHSPYLKSSFVSYS
ncbi:hypothetical protein CASFOL_001524 [Castilleja foliolosa]|uniref:Uncharacterized protein n=1 Tax=Castilleja foliolosa TaxID=1961234 RepID=A0ABD3EJZ6_9LAMI